MEWLHVRQHTNVVATCWRPEKRVRLLDASLSSKLRDCKMKATKWMFIVIFMQLFAYIHTHMHTDVPYYALTSMQNYLGRMKCFHPLIALRHDDTRDSASLRACYYYAAASSYDGSCGGRGLVQCAELQM
jgi:hypothetical protein